MSEAAKIFGGKVRIRSCGLCFDDDAILLVKHDMGNHEFWSPPGGGVQFGETLEECLKREFLEETGLNVTIGDQLFIYEYLNSPFHAIEVYFEIVNWSGSLISGLEPEVKNPILKDAAFLKQHEIDAIPKNDIHGILQNCTKPRQILENRGLIML